MSNLISNHTVATRFIYLHVHAHKLHTFIYGDNYYLKNILKDGYVKLKTNNKFTDDSSTDGVQT